MNNSYMSKSLNWLFALAITFLAITHSIQSVMVLTMWGTGGSEILFEGRYVIDFVLLLSRIVLSIMLFSVFTKISFFWKYVAIFSALALLIINLICLWIDQVAWFSYDPFTINPIMQGTAIPGIILSVLVLLLVVVKTISVKEIGSMGR